MFLTFYIIDKYDPKFTEWNRVFQFYWRAHDIQHTNTDNIVFYIFTKFDIFTTTLIQTRAPYPSIRVKFPSSNFERLRSWQIFSRTVCQKLYVNQKPFKPLENRWHDHILDNAPLAMLLGRGRGTFVFCVHVWISFPQKDCVHGVGRSTDGTKRAKCRGT